ncbi:MAG: DUF1080 domain-containing protein [Muribaculaceae bacterium]|nr:DUF1080 domain-containing protein [Muribaculaceae bacterium]
MNKRSLSIILLSLFLCFGFNSFAQLDSRNRTAETVISDGLAQLPAKNQATYNEVIGEMAATGQKGIEMLAAMLKPAETNQNALFEYAIDAIVSYATRSDNAALQQQIHDGLVAGLKKCTDDPNRAFLMVQLSKLARPGDAEVFASYLTDPYLRNYAINGLALVPGDDEMVAKIINSAAAPEAELAYVAYFKKLNGVEPTLIKWTESADPKVLAAVYNALAVCGTDAAIKPLQKAAKAVKFANDPTGATDAYLRLLARLGDKNAVNAAKEILKADNDYARCAALDIILNSDKANAEKNVLAALKDKDIAYRNTALNDAPVVCGEGIFDVVAGKFKSLSPEAKIDVINWLGNNHVVSQIDLIIDNVNAKDLALAKSAVAAASKIGGDKALVALTSVLGQNNELSAAAQNALLSFNGDIASGVLTALDSTDSNVVSQALQLASARHIYDACDKVVKLMANGNAQVSDVALKSFKGVVRPSDFESVCQILNAVTKPEVVSEIQAAAKNSIVSLTPEEQYNRVNAVMNKQTDSKNVVKYYPLLAQAATPAAIDRLLADFNATNSPEAYAALMQVNNPAMIPVLFEIAANNPAQKDAALNRYIDLVQSNGFPAIDQYRLYSNGLSLEPSVGVQNRLIRALADGRTLPAAMLAAKYLDNKETALAAASTVKYIFAKEPSLQKGLTVKNILDKTHKVFVDFGVNDADAGYAADEVAGILNGFDEEGGYAVVAEGGPTGDFENFDLYFDWNGVEPITLTLRSMPLVTIDPAAGLTVGNGILQALPAGAQPVHVRMVNDRMFVEVGSVPFAVNDVVVNPVAGKETPYSGTVSVSNPEAVRNFYFNHLPDTPIFKLSPEEEAQGFEVLFDGRSLDKWHGNTAAYVPVDGSIYVTAQYGGSGNLYTKKNYSDFIYRFEFFFDVPGVNNGIGIRTGKDVTGVDAAFHGMEIQVLDHDDPMYGGYPYGWTGIQPYQIHGSIYGVVGAKHVDFGPIKQWHTEEIKAVGDHITVTVDGEVIVDADIREACQGHAVGPEGTEGNPYMIDHRNHPGLFNKEGYISFCGHGQGVKFRNIRILDLSEKNNKAKKGKKK